MTEITSLAAKLLIAMPGMGDARFAKSVICLCAHSPEGAMGLIVNKPKPDISFCNLLDQLGVPRGDGARDIRVRYGGPVEHGRGFILHSTDYMPESGTMRIDDAMAMSATLDILEHIADGTGPAQALFALGYAGWGPGQLDAEIADNAWLVADCVPEIVFDDADGTKWLRALHSLGIEPLSLSAAPGRA